MHLHSHSWGFLIRMNIWKVLGNCGRTPVSLYSTQLSWGIPYLLDHIMTLLLVKSINFVPISYAVECFVEWCFTADGVTIDQRVLNEATKANFFKFL